MLADTQHTHNIQTPSGFSHISSCCAIIWLPVRRSDGPGRTWATIIIIFVRYSRRPTIGSIRCFLSIHPAQIKYIYTFGLYNQNTIFIIREYMRSRACGSAECKRHDSLDIWIHSCASDKSFDLYIIWRCLGLKWDLVCVVKGLETKQKRDTSINVFIYIYI